MLSRDLQRKAGAIRRTRQRGVVLVIALIVLVAMTLAAVAIVRSVDTANLIAGNLAFQQAARRSADVGIEKAVSWLEDCNYTHTTCSLVALQSDDNTNGYYAAGAKEHKPEDFDTGANDWDKYWTAHLPSGTVVKLELGGTDGADSAGNKVYYIIDRMCNDKLQATSAGCARSPVVISSTGTAEEGGDKQINAPSVVYYRITVRVEGPRNTISYIQSMVAM